MDERAAFEKWLLEKYELDDEWQPERNCYKHFAAHLAWKAWQERASHSASEESK